ncbi:MAG: MoaF C-terminal domain-containing protein [Jatrophihabitantaceae bacterium]
MAADPMERATAQWSDTSTWLPLDGLAAGFDANKAVPSTDLVGRRITVSATGEPVTEYMFAADEVVWTRSGSRRAERYEAFAVDRGLYFVQLHPAPDADAATSLVLDLDAGRALSVVTSIGAAVPGRTRVRQSFRAGVIEGIQHSGHAIVATTELSGRRALWIYSDEHAYEHVYLSPQWYTWQCLAGPEKGLADTDENTVYVLRPGIYLFAWREKVVPCAAVTVADHRDLRRMRSHGALFGLDGSGRRPVHFTFGAFGRLLSTTAHPADLDPAVEGA